jgi:NitT/TauT family transport system substrate-binding protein
MRLPILFLAALLAALPAHAERIVFAMDWKAQPEQGGFFQALAAGLYKQRGLDVEIRSGGPGLDNQQLMAAGAVDMALGSNSFFALNLVKAGAPVVAVMASLQKDPQVLMAHPDDPAQSLADLKGRPILLSDSSINTMFVWLKSSFGFSDRQIRKYTGNPAPFIVDRRGIQQGYVSSEPFQIRRVAGWTPKVWLLADHGYQGYAAMVLVRRDWIETKHDVVQAFVDATIEGWRQYIAADRTPGDALIQQRNPDISDELIAFAKQQMRERHIVETPDAPIGSMTEARWHALFDVAVSQGVYASDLDWKRAFTLEFLRH